MLISRPSRSPAVVREGGHCAPIPHSAAAQAGSALIGLRSIKIHCQLDDRHRVYPPFFPFLTDFAHFFFHPGHESKTKRKNSAEYCSARSHVGPKKVFFLFTRVLFVSCRPSSRRGKKEHIKKGTMEMNTMAERKGEKSRFPGVSARQIPTFIPTQNGGKAGSFTIVPYENIYIF